jgi:class 3 adenylate cyclase
VSRATDDALSGGQDALDRHAWDEAYRILTEADREGTLRTGHGLELLAEAVYWSGHPEDVIEPLERAYEAYLKEGDRSAAAMAAFRIGEQHGMRFALPQAQGWAAKAERLAAEDPSWPVHGWLAWMRGLMAWFQGDFETAIAQYDDALEFAARTDDRNLHAMSLHDKGHAMVLIGSLSEGMGLLDEAMTAVVGGELVPHAAGYVYCGMIGVCSKLGDYRRAGEWTEATLRWCERQSVPAFPGVCRVHKAELMRLRGSLTHAEREARLACEELPRFNFYSGLGPANYEIGEVRRWLGDFAEADAAYARAHEYGLNPQPGLSLLRLAQGKVDAAAAGIGQALSESGGNKCHEMRLLAAQATIALAADDVETAAAAADRLETIVAGYETTTLQGIAASTRGAVRLAQSDAAGALADLRRARQAWQEVDAPIEVAEVRMLLARAHQALGDVDAAIMEARAARTALEPLGARPAAQRAAELLGELAGAGERPERAERAFLFTDIVKSTDLVGVIGDEAWEDLLTWHDQTLRSLFASHSGDVGHPTGDGFFVAFDDPAAALRCAVAIQRALADHRREHGFALSVRIGVHAGEATRRGQDYGGAEVHKAARIAAQAEGGEILATVETVEATDGRVRGGEPKVLTLKGFAEPVTVLAVDWR